MTEDTTNPLDHLALLRDRIDRLFEAASTRSDFDSSEDAASHWSPLVDLYETADKVVLVAEVPGLSMEDLDVQVTDSTLTLKGERTALASDGEIVHHRLERAHGAFSRTFQLNTAIERDRVTAEYQQGLLRVTLPKSKKSTPRTVQVNRA